MFLNSKDTVYCDPYRRLAIAVVTRAAKDLLTYDTKTKEYKQTESEILRGGLDLWLDVLEYNLTPKEFIEHVFENRKQIEEAELICLNLESATA